MGDPWLLLDLADPFLQGLALRVATRAGYLSQSLRADSSLEASGDELALRARVRGVLARGAKAGASVVLLADLAALGGARAMVLAETLRGDGLAGLFVVRHPADAALARGSDATLAPTREDFEAQLYGLLLRWPRRAALARTDTDGPGPASRPVHAELDAFVAGLPIVLFRARIDPASATFEYVGSAAQQVLGQPPAWFYEDGNRALSLVHAEDRARVFETFRRSIADGSDAFVEYRLRAERRPVRWLQQHARVTIADDGRRTWCGLILDVSDRKELEAQLQLADRLRSVGTLAAGVAHEINNPLAFVHGNVSVALERLPALTENRPAEASDEALVSELRAALTDALEGCGRMRETVNDLRAFARSEASADEVVDLQRVLDVAVRMTRNETRHRARLLELRGPVPPVRGSEARLGQVFVNLIVNALQALPARPPELNELALTTTVRNGLACVEVRDNGVGIAPEHRLRIFEPFFTTKPPGVGTGLGLAVCEGIVTNLGGRIEVESTPGVGSVFRVLLPAIPALREKSTKGSTPATGLARPLARSAPTVPNGPLPSAAPPRDRVRFLQHEEAPAPRAPAPRLAAAPPGSHKPQALLVDDEPLVLAALRRMLSRDFEVHCCEDGAEALSVLADSAPGRFSLLLCDLMMPGLSGREFYEEIAQRYPALEPRFYLLTGGAFAEGLDAFAQALGERVLPKPLDLARLRALLARRAAA